MQMFVLASSSYLWFLEHKMLFVCSVFFFYFSRLVLCAFPCTSYLLGKFSFILWASALICSVQLLSRVQLFWDPVHCSMPGFPVYHQLPEPAQTHVCWVGDAIQPSHPLSPLLLLPSVFPSIRVFPSESVVYIRWPKYWIFIFIWNNL